MEQTFTFTMTETQLRKFENLLDEFNATMKRIQANEPTREEEMTRLDAETKLLLSQIEDEVAQIKRNRKRQRKMIWEQ